jgi:phosphatidylinositol-3-phosphatase
MQGIPADRKTVEYAPFDGNGRVIAKLYAPKHNPVVYFASLANDAECIAKLLPDDAFAAELHGDLARLTWISHDRYQDMHGMSASSAAIDKPDCGYPESGLDHLEIRLGDRYLRETVEAIRAASAWKDGTAIVVVWDGYDYAGTSGDQRQSRSATTERCSAARAPLIVVTSKGGPAHKTDAPFNRYNLLATLRLRTEWIASAMPAIRRNAFIKGLFD